VCLVAVEPVESPEISQGIFRPHWMMGTAPGFTPETLGRSLWLFQRGHGERGWPFQRVHGERSGRLPDVNRSHRLDDLP